jgi:hypothetical protein
MMYGVGDRIVDLGRIRLDGPGKSGKAPPVNKSIAFTRRIQIAPNMERLQERCILLPIPLGRVSWKRMTFSVTTVDKPEGDGPA